MDKKKLLTIEEVAEVFGLSPKTVRHWLWTGKLKGIKIGGSWRVRPEALEEFIFEAEARTSKRKE